jgi:xylulokinase
MTAEKYLLGVDIGTSGAKAGIFSREGRLISLNQNEYAFEHPKPGWSEIDPDEVWAKARLAVKNAVIQSGVEPNTIAAMGLSVIGETGLPVDESGDPLYPAIESMDQRENAYQAYVSWFDETFGAEAIFKRTSYPLNSLPLAHKILYFRDHKPDLFKRIAYFVTFQDFIIWKLCGQPAIDYSMASRTMLFDVRGKEWIEEYLEKMGISKYQFSPPVESFFPVGKLDETAARELGLNPGTIVVPGAHDQSCAALGVGVIKEGVASDGTGSVEAIATSTETPFDSAEMLALGQGSQCHVTSDLYLALGFHLTAGSLVRWYRDQLGRWEQQEAGEMGGDAYDLITQAAEESPPGSNGLLVFPHWIGAGTGRKPPLNPLSRGAVLGLSLMQSKADLNRAVFEGITFETRYLLESLESTGLSISELMVTGGGAKSNFWLQLKADITGKRIKVPSVIEASLLGAALLAGVGAGIYPDLESAVDQACSIERAYEPDMEKAAIYDKYYAVYRDVYQAIIGISSRLVQLATD